MDLKVEVGRRPGGGSRTLYQRSKPLFEFPQPAVFDLQLFVTRSKVVQLLAQLVDDARRVEMKEGGNSVHVDVPTAPGDDVLHLFAERAADHQSGGAHVTFSSCGNPSTETNESLKSE